MSEEDVGALLQWHLPDAATGEEEEGEDPPNVVRYDCAGGHLTMVEVPGSSSPWEAPGGVSDAIARWVDRVC